MINRQRVRLETRMSVYEHKNGRADGRVNNYFRGDYIASQFLHTFVCTTIAFILLLAVLALYNFEQLMLTIYSMNLASVVVMVITAYLVFLAAFLVITFLVYSYRYKRARKRLGRYYKDLQQLAGSYQREEDYEYPA